MSHLTLVTGATGFIGRYVTGQLVAGGARVRVLARRPQALHPLVRRRVEVAEGDVRDRAAVARAVCGVDLILHLAGYARAWSPDDTEFQSVNVDAVETLLETARRHDVGRIVHVSTVLTRFPNTPSPEGRTRSPTAYETSKLAGQRLIEEYARRDGDAVIVHPTRVYGPGPLNGANGVTKLIDLYLRGRLRFRLADGDVGANYVHAADVATGIRQAARWGRSGAHYDLGGPENCSLREFFAIVARLSGVRRRVIPVDARAFLVAAHAARLWGRIGGSVPITPDWIRLFLEDQRVDIATTSAEIGYAPRTLDEGLGQTLAWLRGAPYAPLDRTPGDRMRREAVA